MSGRLDGKVAIVTGGNQGIGQATVHRFAEEGARVAILARREDEGRAVEAAVRDQGGDATFIPCDVTDRQQIAAAAAVAATVAATAVVRESGEPHLDLQTCKQNQCYLQNTLVKL